MKNKSAILNLIQQLATTAITIGLVLLVFTSNAKNIGRFSKYTQVTDKQVLVETSRGVKVLFTAYDNQSIGVEYFGKKDECKLISPSNIINSVGLNGSIYVEEVDELMQITTASKVGISIKIDKSKCSFTFVDKSTKNEMVIDEKIMAGVISSKQMVNLVIDTSNQIGYVLHPRM